MEIDNTVLISKLQMLMEPLKQIDILNLNATLSKNRLNNLKRNKENNKWIVSAIAGFITGFLMIIINYNSIKLYLNGWSIAIYLISFLIVSVPLFIYLKGTEKEPTIKILELEKSIKDDESQTAFLVTNIFSELQNYVPKNYWYYDAVKCFYNYGINRRADNIKEMVNLYEEEIHRAKMENMQNELVRLNKQQTTYAAISAAANVATAINTL